MTFLTALALLGGLLVGLPIAAHFLRSRKLPEVLLPTARWLAIKAPEHRRTRALEDRPLLAVRALMIVLLALLGATPFISCERLSLSRKNGASIAVVLVIDDSLSMRRKDATDPAQSRLERAKSKAKELLESHEPGDEFAVVLAGGGARVALPLTHDEAVIAQAIDGIEPSDRPTDLDDALALAERLIARAPEPDRRIILFSDRADGTGGPALFVKPSGEGPPPSFWEPTPELTLPSQSNCGLVTATRKGAELEVSVACDPARPTAVAFQVLGAGATVAEGSVVGREPAKLTLPTDAPERLDVALLEKDALAEDDVIAVSVGTFHKALGVMSDDARRVIATGGPPPVEQALVALGYGSRIRSLSTIPSTLDELNALDALILDDPPGLTPEERAVLQTWVDQGGQVLVGLGQSARHPPLGANFGSLIPGVTLFRDEPALNPGPCAGLGQSAESLGDLRAKLHASLSPEALADAETLCSFGPSEPFLVSRRLGRGRVVISTLSFSVDESELPLRPAFLSLLEMFVESSEAPGGARLVPTGGVFRFPGEPERSGEYLGRREDAASASEGRGRAEQLSARGDGDFDAARVGRYRFSFPRDGQAPLVEERIAWIPKRELDFKPRDIDSNEVDPSVGSDRAKVDLSPWLALSILLLVAIEGAVRLRGSQGASSHDDRSAPHGDDQGDAQKTRQAADGETA